LKGSTLKLYDFVLTIRDLSGSGPGVRAFVCKAAVADSWSFGR
jgi:hypothetical protein